MCVESLSSQVNPFTLPCGEYPRCSSFLSYIISKRYDNIPWAVVSLFPFTPQIIMRIRNQASKRCQGRLGSAGYVRKAIQGVKRAGNHPGLSFRSKRRS